MDRLDHRSMDGPRDEDRWESLGFAWIDEPTSTSNDDIRRTTTSVGDGRIFPSQMVFRYTRNTCISPTLAFAKAVQQHVRSFKSLLPPHEPRCFSSYCFDPWLPIVLCLPRSNACLLVLGISSQMCCVDIWCSWVDMWRDHPSFQCRRNHIRPRFELPPPKPG